MHLLQVRGDSNRGRARGVTRIGERKVTQYSDVTQSVFHAGYLFCFLYLQISPFPCFNEYQKFRSQELHTTSAASYSRLIDVETTPCVYWVRFCKELFTLCRSMELP